MALGTDQRKIAAALAVASQSFSDQKMGFMVIVVAIVGLILKKGVSESESIAQNRPLKSRDIFRSNHVILAQNRANMNSKSEDQMRMKRKQ